jgi:chromosome condensin MukBEF ATPase and DNA-binding subunit MukB
MTLREALQARIDRLQNKRAQLVAAAQATQAQIGDLQQLLAALSASDDQRLSQLLAAGLIQVRD